MVVLSHSVKIMNHVVVTGVSSGIGQAVAVELLSRGYSVFGSVRKEEDAGQLISDFPSSFTPMLFDVTDNEQIKRAVQQVSAELSRDGLHGLVNNAGISLPGPLSEIQHSMMQRHLDVNVMGVFNVTRAFLPFLQGKSPGKIVNMSSTSGRIALPMMGAYAASKHAVEAISDAWRRELMLFGVDVSVVQAGPIRTPIWDKAGETYNECPYPAYSEVIDRIDLEEFKQHALPPEHVARVIRKAIEAKSPKTRYVVCSERLKYWTLPRLLPDRWLDRLIANTMGLCKTESKRHVRN